VPLWIVDLIEVEGDSLREIAQGFLDRAALAGYIDLKTLCYVPVLFLVYSGGQVARRAHGLSLDPPVKLRCVGVSERGRCPPSWEDVTC
jgi:hypothetical protein